MAREYTWNDILNLRLKYKGNDEVMDLIDAVDRTYNPRGIFKDCGDEE